jgi:hypothetical protein
MRILTILLLLISNLIFSQNTDENKIITDTICIKPGVGIDNIQFGKSTQVDIENYRNMNFKKNDGEGIACGTRPSSYNYTTDYYSKLNGIRFTFSTLWGTEPQKLKNKPKKLVTIDLKQTENACLENGLCIGKSSYDDIIKIMGKPKKWKNEYFLAFYDKGISFHFDNQRIIYSVDIYEPKRKK